MHPSIQFSLLLIVWLPFAVAKDCSTQYINNATIGLISSPLFPDKYPNSIECYHVIRAENEDDIIQLIFYVFDTEDNADYVFLYDGEGENKTLIAKLSGEVRDVFKTNLTSTMTIRFKSDLDRNFQGYYAQYRVISRNESTFPVLEDCPHVTQNLTDPFGVIISPNWPDLYPNQACCVYYLPSPACNITLTFNFFKTEENADILYIYHGNETEKLSGYIAAGTTYVFNEEDLTLKFTSDLDRPDLGYSITYVST
ncbi:unnamed protein product [Bursaphelenchus xylophilus]|uniref:(pine wood nematode) hypothetical protein n=1 Tax=Bursaphelenchus xylophilus TaxID=6326 RepID=A0A1I7RRZ9_BURXY|nr:unnamed protein product [Bursaphelenchus xylophilus]CAG9123355.1 unnamed protein product [Bursaphelenchus xylophilus]